MSSCGIHFGIPLLHMYLFIPMPVASLPLWITVPLSVSPVDLYVFFYMRSCFQCELVYLTCSDLGLGFCICQQLWRISNAEQATAYFMAF